MVLKDFYLCSTAMKKAPSEAPLIQRKAFRPWLCFSHTSYSCWSWVVMNAAADMYLAPQTWCRDKATV